MSGGAGEFQIGHAVICQQERAAGGRQETNERGQIVRIGRIPARQATWLGQLVGCAQIVQTARGACTVSQDPVEQSHGRQFYRYLRSYYDIDAEVKCLARPGPLLITPGEVVRKIEEWSST